jgi:hypothetical protein
MSQTISPDRTWRRITANSGFWSRNRAFRPRTRNRAISVRGIRPSTLSLCSSYAGHGFDLRAAPRVARKGEAWWGKKDSNLRSHKTADLQSAPFATRDTPPLNSIGTHRRNGGTQAPDDVKTGRRWRAPGWPRLWRNRPCKVNQRRPLIRGQEEVKLPLFGTRDTSLR